MGFKVYPDVEEFLCDLKPSPSKVKKVDVLLVGGAIFGSQFFGEKDETWMLKLLVIFGVIFP